MKVSFIGFGAVGAGYGVKFLDVPGVELRVVAAGVRAERLMRDGVVVGGERFEVPVVTPDEPMEPADVVFVAVKYSGLAQAIEDIRGHVGQGTVIVSLMNGVTSEQTLAQAFPQARVLYAFTVQIDTNRVDNRVEYTTLGRIVFGEALNEAPYSDAVELVDELLARVGIEGEIGQDMLHELWWKYMINCGVNQVSAVLRAPYGAFQAEGEARDVMLEAQREVMAISKFAGSELTESDMDRWLTTLDALGPNMYSSMAQDALAGRVTECDAFGGHVHNLGLEFGIPTPTNKILWQLIKAKHPQSTGQ